NQPSPGPICEPLAMATSISAASVVGSPAKAPSSHRAAGSPSAAVTFGGTTRVPPRSGCGLDSVWARAAGGGPAARASRPPAAPQVVRAGLQRIGSSFPAADAAPRWYDESPAARRAPHSPRGTGDATAPSLRRHAQRRPVQFAIVLGELRDLDGLVGGDVVED